MNEKPTGEQAEGILTDFWLADTLEEAKAIFEGHPWIAFERKPKVFVKGETFFIHRAIDEGWDDLIERALDCGVHLEHESSEGRTVLGALLNRLKWDGLDLARWEAQVNRVLDAGARCSVLDVKCKPLWLICSGAIPPAIFNRLLAGGAPVDGMNLDGGPWLSEMLEFAIHPAGGQHGVANCEALIEAGANVNISHPHKVARSPLGTLSRVADTEMHDHLLAHGADARLKDIWGNTLLHKPCSPAMVTWLAANGADVEAKNHEGSTPLMCALMEWSTFDWPSVIALLAAGADADVEFEPGISVRDLIHKRAEEYPELGAALAARDLRADAMAVIDEIATERQNKARQAV